MLALASGVVHSGSACMVICDVLSTTTSCHILIFEPICQGRYKVHTRAMYWVCCGQGVFSTAAESGNNLAVRVATGCHHAPYEHHVDSEGTVS
jgi:hypothetical protein